MDCAGTQDDLAASRNRAFSGPVPDSNASGVPTVEFDAQSIRVGEDFQVGTLAYWSDECVGSAKPLASPDGAGLVAEASRCHRIEIVDVLNMGRPRLRCSRNHGIAEWVPRRMNCYLEWPTVSP